MIDGVWRGGDSNLDIVIEQCDGKLLICLPTEDIFDRSPFVREIAESSLSFSLFNFLFSLSLENNILKGYYIISMGSQRKKNNIELVAINKKIKEDLNNNINRLELLCNNAKYEYEFNISLILVRVSKPAIKKARFVTEVVFSKKTHI